MGRHASISGCSLIQCASVSIAPSSFQEGQNARHHKQFKLEQALAGGKKQAQKLKDELAGRQLIAVAGGGKDGDRYAVKRPIRMADGKNCRPYVIAIDARVLDQG